MSRNREQPDFEVFAPSRGTNHLLDPTQVNQLGSLSTGSQLESSSFIRNQQGLLASKNDAEMEAARAESLYRRSDTVALTQNELLSGAMKRPTEKVKRHDVRGGGPKSTLRTPRKMFSSFGRGVPFSGSVSSFFKSAAAGPAIGQTKHFIPNQGLFDMGISAGPRMLQGPKFAGAFPMLNIHQFNQAHGATPHDAEEED